LRCWFNGSANRYRVPVADLCQLWELQGGRCAMTGDELVPGVNASLDHIGPVQRGGTSDIENLRWVTLQVNHAKRDFSDAAFVTMCRKIVARRGPADEADAGSERES
jgi:hypothetical protein